ncbi:MAG: hypothetical protein R3275_08985 [Saprospiraceae bacterium]|nr:hypothetical protein [Saprospiraceae bacterium]
MKDRTVTRIGFAFYTMEVTIGLAVVMMMTGSVMPKGHQVGHDQQSDGQIPI